MYNFCLRIHWCQPLVARPPPSRDNGSRNENCRNFKFPPKNYNFLNRVKKHFRGVFGVVETDSDMNLAEKFQPCPVGALGVTAPKIQNFAKKCNLFYIHQILTNVPFGLQMYPEGFVGRRIRLWPAIAPKNFIQTRTIPRTWWCLVLTLFSEHCNSIVMTKLCFEDQNVVTEGFLGSRSLLSIVFTRK